MLDVSSLSWCYLEEKCPVTEDSLADHSNRNNIRLQLKLEPAEVKLPWEFMQLCGLHFSTHGFAYQPDTKWHAHKDNYITGTFILEHWLFCTLNSYSDYIRVCILCATCVILGNRY